MRKVKHKYTTSNPYYKDSGNITMTVKVEGGTIGTYDSYGPHSMSRWQTKFEALRYFVKRKHEILNGQRRVQLKKETK